MQFSEEVKATLWNLIDEMSLNLSCFTIHPGKDFTRKKKWDFPTLMKFIISMESQSLKNELHKYFGYTTDCPTNPSFNQRRAQIHPEAFEFLFRKFTAQYSMRWGIETSFRELKYAVGLTSFHAKKREYILQEIWARLILYNFCEVITAHTFIEAA